MKRYLILVLLFSCFSVHAGNNLMYDKANQLYHNKQYTEAVDLYNQLLQDGYLHDAIYYNLGNAYYRSNKIGLAIWGYKKALQLSNRKNYRDNLTLAEKKAGVMRSNQGTIFFIRWWHNLRALLSANVWAILSLCLFSIVFLLLIFGRWKGTGYRYQPVIVSCLVLSLVCMTLALSSVYHKKKAIIIESSIRFSSLQHRSYGELTEGLEVILVKTEGKRCLIVLPDGREGWVDLRSIKSL